MALSPAQPLLSLDGSDVEEDTTMTAPEDVLDTPEGELALLTALIQFRPVGLSRHWAMMAILKNVQARLRCAVTSDSIWRKLEALYDLSLLEEDVSCRCRTLGFLQTFKAETAALMTV
jgi:hypothetical protein